MEHRRRRFPVEPENIASYPVDVADDSTAQLSDMAFSENSLVAMDKDSVLISVIEEDYHPYKRDNHFSEQSHSAVLMQQVKIMEQDPLALPEVKVELKDLLKLSKHEKIDLEDPLDLSAQVKTELKDPLCLSPHVKKELEDPLCLSTHVKTELEDPLNLSPHGNTELEDTLSLSPHGNTEFEDPLDFSHQRNTKLEDPLTLSPQGKTELEDPLDLSPQVNAEFEEPPNLLPYGNTEIWSESIQHKTVTNESGADGFENAEQTQNIVGKERHIAPILVLSPEQSGTLDCVLPHIDSVTDVRRQIISLHPKNPQSDNLCGEKKYGEKLRLVDHEPTAFLITKLIESAIQSAEISQNLNAGTPQQEVPINVRPHIVQPLNPMPKCINKETKMKKNEATVVGNSERVATVRNAKTAAKRRLESSESTNIWESHCKETKKKKNETTVAGNSERVVTVQKAKTAAKCRVKSYDSSYINGSHCNETSGIKYLGEDLKALKLHYNSVDLNFYKCNICKSIKNDKCQIQSHVRAHLNSRPFVCVVCSKAFTNLKNAMKHKTVIHKPQFKCGICSRRFPNKRYFEDHANVHSGHRPYKCKKCSASFPTDVGLYNHTQRVHNRVPVPHLCEECGMVLTNRKCFLKHLQKHRDGQLLYKCTVCSSTSPSRSALKFHMDHHSKVKFTCDICTKSFISKRLISVHIKKVHADGRFECSECGKRYKSKTHLGEHLLFHKGIRKYCCPTCGKTFASQANYDTHKFVHLGKNFVCPVCGAKFNRNDNMKSHVKRMHADGKSKETVRVVRVFACSDCEKSFGTNKLLKDHLLTHDDRCSTCDVCSKSYLSKKRLCNHIMSLHLTC